MQPKKLLKKIAEESYRVIFYPHDFWKERKKKEEGKSIFTRFFSTGFLLMFLAIVLGDVLFESKYGLLFKDTLIKAFRKVLVLVMTFYASVMLLYEISRLHKIPLKVETARELTVYSMVPFVILTIITGFFPFLDVLGIFGLYSFYLLYCALVTFFDLKPEQNIGYFVLLFVSMLLSYTFIAFLLSKLTELIIY